MLESKHYVGMNRGNMMKRDSASVITMASRMAIITTARRDAVGSRAMVNPYVFDYTRKRDYRARMPYWAVVPLTRADRT